MKKVLVGGVFNLIHAGHLFFLKESKKFGDYLVVVVASDRTANASKDYPVFPAEERKRNLEKVGIVDKVVIGEDLDLYRVVKRENPEVIVLGFDQKMDERKIREECKKMGIECRVLRLKKRKKGYSVSKLMKIRKKEE